MRSNEIEIYKTQLRLSPEQSEVLIGILLGDATLETQNKGRTYRIKIEHGLAQRAYTEHLYNIFRHWVTSPPRLRRLVSPKGREYVNIVFSTLSHASLRFYAQQFYKSGKRGVPKLIGRWLTARVLAYWFMDDGSIKSRQSKGVILNTQGYQMRDVFRLIKALQYRFELDAKPRKQPEGYQIYISGKSYERFKGLVSPYMLPEMMYKIPEARRTHLPKV